MPKTKPYKIQDVERKVGRVGITATSLKDLKKKVSLKWKIDGNLRIVLEEDGTEVEDEEYFATLPEESVFVVLKPGEYWDGYITYLQLATKKILDNISAGKDIVAQVQSIFGDKNSTEMVAVLDYIKALDVNIEAETVMDDPDWFDGITGNFKTKEQAMKKSAKGRVRGYLNHSKDFINNSDVDTASRKALLILLDVFRQELKNNRYFEDYFARSASSSARMCDESGWFTCGGRYSEDECEQMHRINPYGTKDARILFKTWNLDHRIEKSREILPGLVKAVQECPETKEVNWSYFFDLLFTRTNLKIVDVRCHVLSSHQGYTVNKNNIYRKRKL